MVQLKDIFAAKNGKTVRSRLKHHLPGVPSQKETAENGVNVGQMQAKMLEKIEELTLHMITLQKENEKLTERLEKIEKN